MEARSDAPDLLTSQAMAARCHDSRSKSIRWKAGGRQARRAVIVRARAQTSKFDAPLERLYQQSGRATRRALVGRYAAAVKSEAERPVGRLAGPALRSDDKLAEQVLGELIADAQLAATAAPDAGGAQIAFMNPGGVRADLNPHAGGVVSFGDLYATQPFGNTLMTASFTGRQLHAILEQQFDEAKAEGPMLLLPSSGYAISTPRPRAIRRDVRLKRRGDYGCAPIADD